MPLPLSVMFFSGRLCGKWQVSTWKVYTWWCYTRLEYCCHFCHYRY